MLCPSLLGKRARTLAAGGEDTLETASRARLAIGYILFGSHLKKYRLPRSGSYKNGIRRVPPSFVAELALGCFAMKKIKSSNNDLQSRSALVLRGHSYAIGMQRGSRLGSFLVIYAIRLPLAAHR